MRAAKEWTPLEAGWFETRRGEKAFVVPAELTDFNRPYGGSVRASYENGSYTAAFLETFKRWGWKRCDPPALR